MDSNNSNPTRSFSGMSIQLSPQRVPPRQEKNPKRQRKLADVAKLPSEEAKNVLFEKLLNDPEKKRMVIQILHENRAIIQEHLQKEQGTSSPINKIKSTVSNDSPTASMKYKMMEKQRKLQQMNAAASAAKFENKMKSLALTPSRKPPKKSLLKGVNAYVEVMDANYTDKSAGVKALLLKMGATVAPKLTSACTHVIYKDGSYETFKKTKQLKLPLVSILWLDVMDRTGIRAPPEIYPALGDYDAKQTCDKLCEKLGTKRRSLSASSLSNISPRKTITSRFELDDDFMINDKDDDEIIESSQPDTNSTLLNMTRQRLQNKSIINNKNTHDDSSSSDMSDASSDTPLIAGRASRKSKAELNASMQLSENLRNNSYIRRTYDADKENSSSSELTTKKSLFKHVTMRRTNTPKTKRVPEEKESDLSPTAVPATPNTPIRTRRTLLHPELLGIIVDETDNASVSMDLTKQRSLLTKTISDTPKNNVTRRKTNNLVTDMEITNANVLPEKTNLTKSVVDRTSISSTNTSKSDDLISFAVKRSSRRNTILQKTPEPSEQIKVISRKSDDKDTNASLEKLSLRISDGTEVAQANKNSSYGTPKSLKNSKSPEKNTKTSTASSSSAKSISDGSDDYQEIVQTKRKTSTAILKTPVVNKKQSNQIMERTRSSLASSANTSTNDLTTRRITRRMTIHMRTNEHNLNVSKSQLSNISDAKTKNSTDAEISLRVSEKTNSSGVPSLRVSVGTSVEGESSSTNSNEGSPGNATKTKQIAVSPLSDLSQKLNKTSISNNKKMNTSSTKTASTCYSIIDDSTDTSRGEQSTRSKSGRPSLISNLTSSRATTTTTSSDASKTSNKRKLCNPDNALEESILDEDDEEEERNIRTQDTQLKLRTDATRKQLEDRLESLPISGNQGAKTRDENKKVHNDDDFEELPLQTQRSQPIPTQTQQKKNKSIVCTRFHSQQIVEFQNIVKKLDEFIIEQNVSSRTTHLVAMEASRTVNLLRAMSRGIWILRSEWLYDSMKAGKWLEEDAYEITEFSPLVQQLRLQRESFGKAFSHDVFTSCGAIHISADCRPSKQDLEELVILCKGEVTNDIEAAKIVIGGNSDNESESKVYVKEGWILDCITFGRCKKFKNYLSNQ